MSIPIPPWWLRVLEGGNARSYAVAALAFVVGYYLGKGDRNHWKDVARSADNHWRKEYGWDNDNHGRHTEREHDRHYKHGEERGR